MKYDRSWIYLLFLVLLAFSLRSWSLAGSGIQNDEQLWHERSARFIQSVLGPWAPKDLRIPKVYIPSPWIVDLTEGRSYPFTIKMPTVHPGTPAGLLMGLSYLLLAEGSSSMSLATGSVIEVTRYPGALFGTLLVLAIFLGGRGLVGDQAALWAALIAAVEPMLVGYSRLARLDMSGAFWVSAAFFAFALAQRTRRMRWAVVAGVLAGLALATNTYGAFLLPSFVTTKVLLGKRHRYPGSEYSLTVVLLASGFIAILLALMVSPGLVESYLVSNPPLSTTAITLIQKVRQMLAGAGAVAIVASLLPVLLIRIRSPWKRWWQQLAIDRLDWVLLSSWPVTYLLVYPNLWPNPVKGFYEIIRLNLSLPQVAGEASTRMPVSHWFYILRSPEHVLPWVLVLAFLGLLFGLHASNARKAMLVLVVWGAFTVALHSIPAGRKGTKNFLQVMPVLCLLAGVGVQRLINLAECRLRLPKVVLMASAACLILGGGILTTAVWWPYPQLFTWPWRPDPQTLSIRELVGEGEGTKEAVEYIQQQGPVGARIGCFTGENNAAYYYDAALLGSPSRPDQLTDYDWLLVLPKLTFEAPDDHPLVHWVRTHEPTHIIYHHQIELVRLYRLNVD